MATRMQQRRGTAAQWISTNSGNGPILAPGEIGFESDTNKFKIGDGVNHWVDLTYFTDAQSAIDSLSSLVDGAPDLLNTLNEIAAALGDDPAFFTTVATNLSNHESDSTNVHGIANTADLATKNYVDTAIGNIDALPSQTGNAGEFLTTDGTTASWATVDLSTKANISNPEFTTGDAGTIVAPAYSGPQGAMSSTVAVIYGLSGANAGYNTYDKNHIPSGWENHIPTDMSYYVGKVMVISGGEYSAYEGEWPILEAAIGPQNQGYPIVFGLGNSFPGANTSNNGATVYIKSANTLKTISSTELGYLDGLTTNVNTKFSDIDTALGTKANSADIAELAQDAVGNAVGNGLKYTDASGAIEPDLALSGGLYIDNSDKLAVDGYYVTFNGAEQTLTNKTLTSPKINEDVALTATATELNYVDGVTSAIQTQIDAKAPSADPTFTVSYTTPYAITNQAAIDGPAWFNGLSDGHLTTIDPVTGALTYPTYDNGSFNGYETKTYAQWSSVWPDLLSYISVPTVATATVSATELRYLDGVTSAIQTQLNSKQAAVSGVSSTEIGYLDGVTSAIQTQLNNKAPIANPTFTGAVTLAQAPTSDLQAATKLYVDNVAAGINFHESVHAASVANSGAIYDNGTNGIGATLTADTNRAFSTIDGESVALGQRVLMKNQTDAKQNGIYTLTTVGVAGTTPWVLTRATDADNNPTGEMKAGDFTFVQNGAVNASLGFVNNSTANPIVIGTDEISYTEFNAAKTIVAGNGLEEATPGILSIDTSITQARVAGVSDTEIGYLSSVTSDIQTQLDDKASISYVDGALTGVTTDITAMAGAGLEYNLITEQFDVDTTLIQARVTDVTDTEIGYLDGVTSAIQTQLDAKIAKSLVDAAGDLIVGTADNTVSRLAAGTDGYFLKADSSTAEGLSWASVPAPANATPTVSGLVYGFTEQTVNGYNLSNNSIGLDALSSISGGEYNNAFGRDALFSLVSGENNSAFGNQALLNTESSNNSAFGSNSLRSNSSGVANSAFGSEALYSNQTSSLNSAFGYQALYSATNESNSAFGSLALTASVNGYGNSAFGDHSLYALSSGNENLAIGYYAGETQTSGSNNIIIGTTASSSSSSSSNEITLGNGNITRLRIPGLDLDTNAAADGQVLGWNDSTGKFTWITPASSSVPTQVLTTNETTAVDTNALSSFRTIEYTVSIAQGSKTRSCKILAQGNGSTVDYVEYAVISTGGTISGVLVEFVTSGSNAELKVRVSDASGTNATVRYTKEIM